MSKLAEDWREIAAKLDLDLVAPFRVILPNGIAIEVDALLRNFGGVKGMLLVDDYSKIRDHASAIVDCGYGYSTLPWYSSEDDGPDHDYDMVKEMLAEWTWTGAAVDKPGWLADEPIDDE